MSNGFRFLALALFAQIPLLPAPGDWANFGPPLPYLFDLAVSPEDPLVVYVGAGDFVRGDDGIVRNPSALFRSEDGGASWAEVADPSDSSRVYATSAQVGFFSPQAAVSRSLDGGVTWENFNGRAGAQIFGLAISSTGKVLYGFSNMYAGGVFRRQIAKQRTLPPR